MTSAITSSSVSAATRAALGRKYALLARWRGAKDRVEGRAVEDLAEKGRVEEGRVVESGGERVAAEDLAARPAMRALAEEFPGALRELDLLGHAELERRAGVLARGDADEPWIAWIAAYHDLMRGVLGEKRKAATLPATESVREAVHAAFGAHPPSAREDVAADLARSLARPGGGRISVAVLREVARQFELSADEIAAVLFPSRR